MPVLPLVRGRERYRGAQHMSASHQNQDRLRSPQGSPLQNVLFIPGSLQPATSRYVRRVGRPRKEWVPHVMGEAYRITGSPQNLTATAQDEKRWKRFVKEAA